MDPAGIRRLGKKASSQIQIKAKYLEGGPVRLVGPIYTSISNGPPLAIIARTKAVLSQDGGYDIGLDTVCGDGSLECPKFTEKEDRQRLCNSGRVQKLNTHTFLN